VTEEPISVAERRRIKEDVEMRKHALKYAMDIMAGGNASSDDVLVIAEKFYEFMKGLLWR